VTQTDVDYLRGKVDGVIAINDSYRLAPWADVLYACDGKWWYWHYEKGAKGFAGLKYSIDPVARRHRGVQILQKTGETGLELKPTGLKAGRNSGYQAINLAVHLGARRVILLGYDMRGDHWFGQHPDKSRPPFVICLARFQTLVEPLAKAGVEVINCSAKTALTCFPRMPLAEALVRGWRDQLYEHLEQKT